MKLNKLMNFVMCRIAYPASPGYNPNIYSEIDSRYEHFCWECSEIDAFNSRPLMWRFWVLRLEPMWLLAQQPLNKKRLKREREQTLAENAAYDPFGE